MHPIPVVFFTSVGLMYGAPTTIGRLWFNQSAAALGNFVGGAFLIAGTAHAMNHWVSIFSFLPARWSAPALGGLGVEAGTFAAHDVESTHHARDFATHAEADEHRQELKRHISLSMSQARERRTGRDKEVRVFVLPVLTIGTEIRCPSFRDSSVARHFKLLHV